MTYFENLSDNLKITCSVIILIILICIIFKCCNIEFYNSLNDIHPSATSTHPYLIPLQDGSYENQSSYHMPGISYRNAPREGGYDVSEDRTQYGMDLMYPKEVSLHELTDNIRRPYVTYKSNNKNYPPASVTKIRDNIDWKQQKDISGSFNDPSTNKKLFDNTIKRVQ